MNNLTKLTDLTNQINIIIDRCDLIGFFGFMHEAKPKNMQGYTLQYNEDNITLSYGGCVQLLDTGWAWKNRRIINDWTWKNYK